MPYEIHFDISGIVIILILLYVFFTYKRFPAWRNRVYFLLLIDSLVAIILDIVTCYTDAYWPGGMITWNKLLVILQILTINFIPILYYIFVISMTHSRMELSRRHLLIIGGVLLYELPAIILSPFTHFVMYFAEDGSYHHGPGMETLYIIGLLFLIFGLYQIIKYSKRLDDHQISVSIFYTLANSAAIIVQYFNPYLLITGFACAISLFLMYLTLQNPLEFIDSTTGTYSREAFGEIIYNEVDSNKYCSLVVLQITNIEAIRRQFGMENGYYLVKEFTKRLTAVCRNNNLFRIFGYCYVFICRDKKEAFGEIDAILEFLKTPVSVDLKNSAISVIEYPVAANLFLFENIQEIQYVNTKKPRINIEDIISIIQFVVSGTAEHNEIDFTYIDKNIIKKYRDKKTIERTVQEAIKNESFEVFLQPIFDLRSKTFVGAESLIRLKGADGVYIPPSAFIPEAERSGGILEIGNISLKKTCQFMKDADIENLGIKVVNVNLSMIQCMQDGIVNHLMNIIETYGIPKNMIQFEITETMVADDADRLAEVIKDLAEEGISFALDDYGMGYSNAARVMHYHFAEVKFDKSLVDAAEKDTGNMILLKHLMSMVKEAGMLALAEGVETAETSATLESIGCDLIQGYYYAKPMPCGKFVEFMKKWVVEHHS